MSEKSDWEQGYDQAMRRTYDERIGARKRIAELEEKQRWIPVSERLPEKYTPVWVTTTWGEQHSGNLTDDCWTGLFRDFREGEITHWLPLPPNPESPNDTQTQTIVYGKESEE